MSKLHTRIEVTVELLSPLHIGTGTELLLDYDLVPHGEHTYRVDEEALLEHALVEAEAAGAGAVTRLLTGRPAAELLTEADFADPYGPLFRYVMPGMPFTKTAGAKMQEQIKDVHDRLYLPGSSLKGALRTVLAWGIYTSQKRKPDLAQLKRSRSWAAQPLEQDLFGRDPNRDWLRALHVEDSRPLEPDGHPSIGSSTGSSHSARQALALRTVRVYPTATKDSPGLNVDVEAVEGGAVFHTAITVDEYGFQGQAAQRLGWQGKRQWIERLPMLAKRHARQRLLAEADYFKAKGGPTGALRFYDELINTWSELAENELIVQIGWGAGWESKTLGSGLLRTDDRAFERLLSQYRMTKERDRRPGDPFPKSRHLVLDRHDRPAEPLGWVRIKLVGFVPGEEPEVAPPRREERIEHTPAPPEGRPQRPEDLRPGQVLEGTVRNIVHFGAFVDVGVGHDGLVHISELSEEHVARVEDVVRVGQRVRARVLNVEQRGQKWRIGLTMKGVEQAK